MKEIEVNSTEIEEKESKTKEENELICPICHSDSVVLSGRCATCMTCGWSKCSI